MQKTAALPRDIAAFTMLRGLAAWWVVLYHVRDHFMMYWPNWFDHLAGKGYLAVDFFFILSGFVIQLNYGHKMEPRSGQWLGFWIKRLARIYPLHLLSLLLVIIYSAALITSGRPLTPNYDMSHLWMQILLIHNWGFTSHLAWNVPSWSISTEWGAYLLFPFWCLVLQGQKRRSATLICVLLISAALLCLLYAGQGYRLLGQNIMHYGLFRCVLQFAMGSVLCILWQRHGHIRGWGYASAAGAAMLGLMAYIWEWPEIFWLSLLWVLLLYAIASLTASLKPAYMMQPFVFLGDASYATYLLHYVLFIYWKALFWSADMQAPLWHLFAFMAVLLGLSGLTYVYFEKPAQRWVMNLWFVQKRPQGVARW